MKQSITSVLLLLLLLLNGTNSMKRNRSPEKHTESKSAKLTHELIDDKSKDEGSNPSSGPRQVQPGPLHGGSNSGTVSIQPSVIASDALIGAEVKSLFEKSQ
jgi:hypothetical protein